MNILRNAIETPDGTILESYHRHDFKTHLDSVTGETYMLDGGLSYIRGSVNKIPATSLVLTEDDPLTKTRENFSWGCRGINGDQPLKRVLLKDLSNEHITNIVNTQVHLPDYMVDLFVEELLYRADNGIEILDGGY